jgi:hypothetical protein
VVTLVRNANYNAGHEILFPHERCDNDRPRQKQCNNISKNIITFWSGVSIEVAVSFSIFAIAFRARRLRSAACVYSEAIAVPVHPKIAFSSATVAPFSAALVAPILRQPCAERLCKPAATQASLKAVPKDSFLNGLPFLPQMKARSPIGPASSVRCRTGKIGSVACDRRLVSRHELRRSVFAFDPDPLCA